MTQPDAWMAGASRSFAPPSELRPEIPHPARIYNYWLGGKDNFAADREAAEAMLGLGESVRTAARANRAVLQRAVRLLAGQGISQFLDIGTGIPAAGNTHEIAQSVNPAARVVYVDNDPIVLAHARALMSGAGHGETRVLQADLRDTDAILGSEEVQRLIDFGQPVALLLVAVLHFVPDQDDPHAVVARLVDALPPGSHLVLTHGCSDQLTETENKEAASVYSRASAGLSLRPQAAVARFFDGLELLPPGLVQAPLWRPDTEPPEGSDRLGIVAGVARKR